LGKSSAVVARLGKGEIPESLLMLFIDRVSARAAIARPRSARSAIFMSALGAQRA
jgi:hypothetical protein